MADPEDFQQVVVSDLPGIEVDLDRLCMITDIAVVRIDRLATCISHACADNALDYPKLGVRSPESPQPEAGRFENNGGGRIDGWHLLRRQVGFMFNIHG